MKISPQLKSIIKNDMGVFMCTFPPIFFAILFTFLFIKSEIHKDQYDLIETIYISITVFLTLSLFLWPFILWWWYVIRQTFKTGIELTTQSQKINFKFGLGLGIEYTFEYQGNKIEHIASLVSNKTTKKLANEESLTVIYNPKKNISFIKELYC